MSNLETLEKSKVESILPYPVTTEVVADFHPRKEFQEAVPILYKAYIQALSDDAKTKNKEGGLYSSTGVYGMSRPNAFRSIMQYAINAEWCDFVLDRDDKVKNSQEKLKYDQRQKLESELRGTETELSKFGTEGTHQYRIIKTLRAGVRYMYEHEGTNNEIYNKDSLLRLFRETPIEKDTN